MNIFYLNRWKVLFMVIVWSTIFIALSVLHYTRFELLNIVGFLTLALLPGILTILIARIKGLPFWGYITVTVGFSILELMLIGLIGNTFLPVLGIARPLDAPILLTEFYFLIGILSMIALLRMETLEIPIKRYILFDTARDLIISIAPILFVILSILGAISLNNGGGNFFTMLMLGAMGVYIAMLTYYSKECEDNTLPTAIFFMALSLLLMTTFRGWFVTGHDIQRETQYFELTKISGFWNIPPSNDAYNACLSITILPTIFANILNVADQYIFKFFFQIFFALCPVLVYLIARHWMSRRISFFAAIYFMAFPTFFTDMPFIVRQEIAFVFFGLMLYLIFEPTLALRTKRSLFVLMGIGVILSHYSTTYTILIILGLVVISTPLLVKLFRALKIPSIGGIGGESKITMGMVVVLLILSFLWTSTITHTGGQVSSVVTQTFQAIGNGFNGNNRSIDANNLLSFSQSNPTQELQGYISTTVGQLRASAPTGTYFDQALLNQYPIALALNQTLPPTSFGKFLNDFALPISGSVTFLGTLLSKLMEILVPAGLICILFKKQHVKKLDAQFYWIAFYCLVFVAANIILPVLSAQYGVFRALQQSLFVLGIFIVVASDMLGEDFSSILVIVFFLYSTAFIPQLIGGNTPDLHLNNTGSYYDNYLVTGTEASGEAWFMENVPSTSPLLVPPPFPPGIDLLGQSAFQSISTFQSVAGSTPNNDILPALIKKDSYVFLGEGTVEGGQASFSYNGDLVDYSYPIQFLGDNKDLIYNNGGTEIYR